MRIALIACSKSKLKEPAPAYALYTGALFKASRTYARGNCDGYYILSAKHFLVDPAYTISPYEKTLTKMTFLERKAWAREVARQVRRTVMPGDTLVFLAGQRYRDWLELDLSRDFTIETPLKGLGIGEQLHWLKEAA